MLKRIKETLTCNSSGRERESRTINRLKSRHLLHSDKNTYFYKNNSKGFFRLFRQPDQYSRNKLQIEFTSPCANDIRWTSSHHDLDESATDSSRVNRTRSSRETMSYSASSRQTQSRQKLAINGWSASIIPLMLSTFGLLLVLSVMVISPVGTGGGVENAYATETTVPTTSGQSTDAAPSIALTLPDYTEEQEAAGILLQEQVDSSSNVGSLSIDFNVKATNIDKYDVYVQSASSALVGEANGGRVESISSDTTYTNMQNQAGWGYAVAKGSKVDTETLTYKPIQTSVNTSADSGTASDTSIDQTYTLAFAANLTGATADHYKSNITLSIAAGATQVMTLYSVTYNTNGSTGGTTPLTQTAESKSENYTFTAPLQNDLVRDGYAFMGWSENPASPIQQYDPGATINLTNTDANKTLYAMWGKEYTVNFSLGDAGTGSIAPIAEKVLVANFPYTYTPKVTSTTGSQNLIYKAGYAPNGWNDVTFTNDNPSPTTTPLWTTDITATNITTMQNINNTICRALTGAGKQLFDVRDGKNYWVAKLKDGNCWMTQNLAIDLTNKTLTTDSSDVGDDWIPVVTGWSGDSAINWQISTTGSGHGSYGGYYTWQAATANTAPASTGEASGSICPKGWRLPINGEVSVDKSYSKLLDGVTTFAEVQAAPYYFAPSGYIDSGIFYNVDSHGYYWSSTASGATYAYFLGFNPSNVVPSYGSVRRVGYSVRCVAR